MCDHKNGQKAKEKRKQVISRFIGNYHGYYWERPMAFHRRWFRWGAVRSDEGYEVAFVGIVPRGRKLRYSEGENSVTCLGEQSTVLQGSQCQWGLHFALDDRHLTNWDNGSAISAVERDAIRDRIHAALEYMSVPHTIDRK